ncbi:MAG: hypothetical protein ABI862_15355, partial [Ilumatobacteraceae bacterium]
MLRRIAEVIGRAFVPFAGLALILIALPATPADAHALNLFVAGAVVTVGSVAWLVGRSTQGVCAVMAGAALACTAVVDATSGTASL